MALLVFLAGAAGTGVVAAYFFLGADDLLHLLRISGAGHASLFQFAALAAHEGFFQLVRGSGNHSGRTAAIAIAAVLRWNS